MTQFRFDVVLHIDVAPRSPSPAAGLAWADSPGLDNIGDMLRGGPPSLEVRGIPDARCATALSAERVLDEPLPGATAHGLRTATGSSAADVAPDDLAALGARYGYTVATALDLGAPGHFNAVLCRDTVAGRRAVLPADDAAAADSPEPLANSPMRIARRGKFLTDLRRRLDDRLPAAHVPSTFVVLDALPRLSDGSVNRAGLPAPAGPRHRRSPRTPPRDRIEREVAIVWSDVLEVCDIGVTDRLVEDLGVDDVRGSILAATLREKFQIRLGLHDLRCEPTIAAVARRISRPHERGGAADARRA